MKAQVQMSNSKICENPIVVLYSKLEEAKEGRVYDTIYETGSINDIQNP